MRETKGKEKPIEKVLSKKGEGIKCIDTKRKEIVKVKMSERYNPWSTRTYLSNLIIRRLLVV